LQYRKDSAHTPLLLRHEVMDFMFSNPTMLDDLDFLYKSDTARKLMFFYQVRRPMKP
jgi:hypothetical protein